MLAGAPAGAAPPAGAAHAAAGAEERLGRALAGKMDGETSAGLQREGGPPVTGESPPREQLLHLLRAQESRWGHYHLESGGAAVWARQRLRVAGFRRLTRTLDALLDQERPAAGATCPVSTGGGTRRVQFVREGGGGRQRAGQRAARGARRRRNALPAQLRRRAALGRPARPARRAAG